LATWSIGTGHDTAGRIPPKYHGEWCTAKPADDFTLCKDFKTSGPMGRLIIGESKITVIMVHDGAKKVCIPEMGRASGSRWYMHTDCTEYNREGHRTVPAPTGNRWRDDLLKAEDRYMTLRLERADRDGKPTLKFDVMNMNDDDHKFWFKSKVEAMEYERKLEDVYAEPKPGETNLPDLTENLFDEGPRVDLSKPSRKAPVVIFRMNFQSAPCRAPNF